MNPIFRKFLSAMLLLVTGAIVGPVAIAAYGAWASAGNGTGLGKDNEAVRLVQAYRQRLPKHHLFLSFPPREDGAECGYDPNEIFPDPWEQLVKANKSQAFTDYAGYFALDNWRSKSRDNEWISAITTSIDEKMTDFEAGFLRRCIEATVFSELCMKRVSGFGNSDSIPRRKHDRPINPTRGIGIEDQIVCTYVDGVAARRNIALSPWLADDD